MNIKQILSGMATIFTILPASGAPTVQVEIKSDCENLSNDWRMVGNDLRKGIDATYIPEVKKTVTL